jgi:tetratricopeptide (TPR) repeat protein
LEDYFEEAFDILDGVYRDRPSGKDLAELHQRRVEKAESPGERLDMRRGLAQVLEDECRDPEAALSVLQEGLFDDPADEGLRDEMERLLLVTGAWSRAAHAMLEVVSRLGEDLDKLVGRQMSERAGVWLRDRAGDADAAEQAFLRAFELDPESDDILEQLEALQLAPGKESRLFVTLRYRATMAVDEGSKIEFLKRCQELAQRLGDRDLSEQVLREILEADPEDKVALEDLTYLRKAAQDHAETFELLAKRVELESDPDKLRMLRLESAALARDELNRVDDAIDLLKTIFEEDPSDIDVAAQLRRAYESAERFDELGELIGRLMGSVSEPPQSLDLKLSLARLRRDQFDDLDRALLLFSEVFEADPRNKEAASDLRAAYEQTERFDDLAGLLIKQSEVAEVDGDVGIAVELLREVANIREEKQGDLEAAIRTWTKIREREDTLEVLESIYRLQLAAGNKRDAASSLEEICRSVDDRERRTRRGELSELYRSLGDQELLIRTIEGSVELWPGDAELRSLLRQEYETVGAWDKVAEMIVLDAGKATEVAEQVKLYREAAQIHSEKRSDMASAIPNLQKAAELSPDDRELQLELCDAYSASGRGAESIAVLEQIVQSYGGKRSKELGEIHRRLATAYLSENDAERALAELDRAFRIEPGNVNVLRQLGEVALQAGDLKKAQQMFRALLLQRLDGNSPITKAEVFCRLGQVHQQLGENPKAKQMFERALQADPSLEDAQTGLSSLK